MYECAVIGCGPAGMAAALGAWREGLRKIIIIDRDTSGGGILNQCIHNGFGLHYFGEELTGPEYAGRFEKMLGETEIEIRLDTMILGLAGGTISMVSSAAGYEKIQAKSIVLAMGCRERSRGALAIPGSRPAGIFTAGAAQRYINIEGFMVGRRAVILGSGDIGLIMARRMTLEGARVLACLEKLPYPGGLTRNIVQCLEDYHIPLFLSHTIINIEGRRRLERVTAARVDENGKPVKGSEMYFDCDTLLLSVGLIPENELSRQAGIAIDGRTGGAEVFGSMETSVPGIFACGNVVHVHDLVDYVSAEGEKAGRAAAAFVRGEKPAGPGLRVRAGKGVRYTVPQRLRSAGEGNEFFLRVTRIFGKSSIKLLVESEGEGQKEIAAFSRPVMAPGEMEKITIDPKILSPFFSKPETVFVIGAEEA